MCRICTANSRNQPQLCAKCRAPGLSGKIMWPLQTSLSICKRLLITATPLECSSQLPCLHTNNYLKYHSVSRDQRMYSCLSCCAPNRHKCHVHAFEAAHACSFFFAFFLRSALSPFLALTFCTSPSRCGTATPLGLMSLSPEDPTSPHNTVGSTRLHTPVTIPPAGTHWHLSQECSTYSRRTRMPTGQKK